VRRRAPRQIDADHLFHRHDRQPMKEPVRHERATRRLRRLSVNFLAFHHERRDLEDLRRLSGRPGRSCPRRSLRGRLLAELLVDRVLRVAADGPLLDRNEFWRGAVRRSRSTRLSRSLLIPEGVELGPSARRGSRRRGGARGGRRGMGRPSGVLRSPSRLRAHRAFSFRFAGLVGGHPRRSPSEVSHGGWARGTREASDPKDALPRRSSVLNRACARGSGLLC
jgi:hypothetical protein